MTSYWRLFVRILCRKCELNADFKVEHLTKTYGEKTLFKDANFIINEHDRIGLIGTQWFGRKQRC